MSKPLLTVAIQYEQDVVVARQRARQIAALVGFDGQDQAVLQKSELNADTARAILSRNGL